MSSTVRPVLHIEAYAHLVASRAFDIDRLGERLFRGQGPRG